MDSVLCKVALMCNFVIDKYFLRLGALQYVRGLLGLFYWSYQSLICKFSSHTALFIHLQI